jgi:hypothetical protein
LLKFLIINQSLILENSIRVISDLNKRFNKVSKPYKCTYNNIILTNFKNLIQ